MSKLQTLVKQVETCRLCPLCRGRRQAVPGEGNENATVMLIGEGPGYHEDQQGRPFIGPAGQFLDELLELADLRRSDVYITNVVKCRPPNNRDPLPLEIETCAPYLERQIAAINPRVIVTLGRYSMAKFVNETSISRIHGKAWQQDGRLVVTMYHPAAGLHNQQLKDVIREDFRKLPSYIAQARQIDPAPPNTPPHPPADPHALLDAYALLIAAQAPSEPMVTTTIVAEPAAIFVAPAEPLEPAMPTPTEAVGEDGPIEPAVDVVVPPSILAEAAPPSEAGLVASAPDLETPPILEGAPAPARRERRRKGGAESAPGPVVAVPTLEMNTLPGETGLAPVEAEAPAANGHAARMEAPAPTAPAPPAPEPMPAETPAPPGRKKGKPAADAEQLSMF